MGHNHCLLVTPLDTPRVLQDAAGSCLVSPRLSLASSGHKTLKHTSSRPTNEPKISQRGYIYIYHIYTYTHMYIYDMCVCDLHSVALAGPELCRSGWPQTQGSALQGSVTLPHVDVDAAISQDIIALHLGPLLCNEHQTAPTPPKSQGGAPQVTSLIVFVPAPPQGASSPRSAAQITQL